MCVVAFVEIFFNNSVCMQYKISMLSNPFKNAALVLILIFIAAVRYNRCLWSIHCLSLIYLINAKQIVLSLTNTLFIIHPVMIYLFSIACLLSVFKKKQKINQVYLLFFAIFLGGVWSAQELNWGGWWNWDVLECGIGYFWILTVFFSHYSFKKLNSGSSLIGIKLAFILTVYNLLNKYGLGTSIHSFVGSKNLKFNYGYISILYTLIFFIYIAILNYNYIVYLVVLLLMYTYFKTLSFIKIIILHAPVYVFYSYRRFIRKTYIRESHKIVSTIYLILAFLNFYNVGYTYNFSLYTNVSNLFAKKNMPAIDIYSSYQFNIYVWKDIWLIKPKYTNGLAFNINSTRTINLRFFSHTMIK